MAGAEAHTHFATFTARLKPCPCYKAPRIEFFRSLFSPCCFNSPKMTGLREFRNSLVSLGKEFNSRGQAPERGRKKQAQ
jgi:hypothetical protein